ncbi:SHOCT domain-containing protein [Geitlerinema sp. PCC 9228]|jgi:hypothetical protein|uniref:SHOCT domain-containing protein n=1 Tax=Geitlerinema sp. PCC 9228 TaxID=111611 RepID=UPI0008F9B48F|nr:SHOCT domain-containing protein [Geitlerinema sp. PCC 9228]
MARNYFSSPNSEATASAYRSILLWFKERQYHVDSTEADGVYLIQAAKSGTLRTLFGANLAFKVKIYDSEAPSTPNEFIVETSTGKWVQNLAGAGITSMVLGGFPIITGVASAGWALVLENQLIDRIKNTLELTCIKREEAPSARNPQGDIQPQTSDRTSQERLQKLEKALEAGILTEEEFQMKKAALESEADEEVMEAAIQKKLEQLHEAFSNGILDANEYEAKVQEVEAAAKKQLEQEQYEKEKAEKIAKFTEALENGILTEEEYKQKIANL